MKEPTFHKIFDTGNQVSNSVTSQWQIIFQTIIGSVEFNIKVPLTKRHKALSRKFHLKPKGTNNRKRVLAKLNKEDEKIVNRKKDKKNKVVSELKSKYDVIVIQKDCIAKWKMEGHGKEIHNSAIGGIIEEISKIPSTLIVDRWYPSTQECYVCKKLNKLGLEERIYRCSCGNVEKRDLHSAKNILRKGLENHLRNIGDLKMPVELNPLLNCLSVVQQDLVLKQEATVIYDVVIHS